MSLCGLRKKPSPYKPLRLRARPVSDVKAGKAIARDSSGLHDGHNPSSSYVSDKQFFIERNVDLHEHPYWQSEEHSGGERELDLDQLDIHSTFRPIKPKDSTPETQWAREDQLSVILESENSLDEIRRQNTPPTWDDDDLDIGRDFGVRYPPSQQSQSRVGRTPRIPGFKKTRFVDQDFIPEDDYYSQDRRLLSMSDTSRSRKSPSPMPRPIQAPPRDLESISRVDASLIFEHFTANDAWELGSALRNRLFPIPTPVVINISLANQNQTLFHTCTHSGVMPDNDNWVARKRKTVLRWGCSTWYMHCKFGGDEVAFREKYGLGNDAGSYAIHGGGVPIRVTGVEGVVAVVVVSGLKQDEDHAVIVEVIRDLYY